MPAEIRARAVVAIAMLLAGCSAPPEAAPPAPPPMPPPVEKPAPPPARRHTPRIPAPSHAIDQPALDDAMGRLDRAIKNLNQLIDRPAEPTKPQESEP